MAFSRSRVLVLGALCVLGVLLGLLVMGYVAGSALSSSAPAQVGPAPTDLPFAEVSFPSRSGAVLSGWFARNPAARGGVLLLHGVRSNRLSMLPRARFLYAAGYSVLAIDLQAHGQSSGDTITFGGLEALDARSAASFLKSELDDQPLAAIGTSLGGAACVLGPEPLAVDALIVEGAFSDIVNATRNRLRQRYGTIGALFTPLLTLQIEPRSGISLDELRPISAIPSVRCPLLVMGGDRDVRTTAEETRALFTASPDPKELWLVPGARHQDLHAYSAEEYERRVLGFLRQHLPREERVRR